MVGEADLGQCLSVRHAELVVFDQIKIFVHAFQIAPLLFVLRHHGVANQRHDLLRRVQLVLALHRDRVQLLFQSDVFRGHVLRETILAVNIFVAKPRCV